MLIAVDKNGNRIYPRKNIDACCPICKKRVIAACGDIMIHHWKHESIVDCDTWKGEETEWHQGWKKEFPIDWQEVVIEKNGEIHRADIMTSTGLVIELQHSNISTTAIMEREKFYNKMVWLIDAKPFIENIQMYSVVNSELKILENSYNMYRNSLPETNEIIEGLQKELKKLEKKYSYTLNKIQYNKDDCQLISNKINTIEQVLDTVMHELPVSLKESLDEDGVTLKRQLREINNKCIELQKQNQSHKKRIDLIASFPKCEIPEFTDYRYVDTKLVNPSSYQKCAFVKPASFFPFIPKSEIEFRNFAKKSPSYKLIIDLTSDLSDCISKRDQTQLELTELDTKEKYLRNQLKEHIRKIFEQQKNEYLRNVSENTEHANELQLLIADKREEISNEREKVTQAAIIRNENLEREQQNEKYEIMNMYKGKYTYQWKHRRATWNYARQNLFFDFGNFIFEDMGDNILKKMSKAEFIQRIKEWR